MHVTSAVVLVADSVALWHMFVASDTVTVWHILTHRV